MVSLAERLELHLLDEGPLRRDDLPLGPPLGELAALEARCKAESDANKDVERRDAMLEQIKSLVPVVTKIKGQLAKMNERFIKLEQRPRGEIH